MYIQDLKCVSCNLVKLNNTFISYDADHQQAYVVGVTYV